MSSQIEIASKIAKKFGFETTEVENVTNNDLVMYVRPVNAKHLRITIGTACLYTENRMRSLFEDMIARASDIANQQILVPLKGMKGVKVHG